MTIKEALKLRVPRIRKPNWAFENDYLRLPLFPDGMVGPWAELYAPVTQAEILHIEIGSQKIPMFGLDDDKEDDWEPYTGTPHAAELNNFAKTYSET
jgi:hypothetical protein